MSVLLRAVSDREKGELPLSIGTSMAIESLCGLGEEFYTKDPAINHIDELWINLRTLFRNLYGSISRTIRDSMLPDALLVGLTDDMRTIEATIAKASQGRVSVVFYMCRFDDFTQVFPNGHYKELRTEKQKVEQALENQTLEMLIEEEPSMDVRTYRTRMTDRDRGRTFIITHYPVDLLWARNYQDLKLLESHTGAIKSPVDWHTKLTGGKDLSRMPLNRLTLQVFGDGNVLFASMTPKIKKEITDLADKYKWTPLTTEEKVRYGLSRLYDPRVKTFFTSLL